MGNPGTSIRLTSYVSLHLRIASRLTVLACGVSVIAIGCLTLIGYASGVVGLYQWEPAAIGMAPNTALGFLLSGIGIAVLGSSDRVWRCS